MKPALGWPGFHSSDTLKPETFRDSPCSFPFRSLSLAAATSIASAFAYRKMNRRAKLSLLNAFFRIRYPFRRSLKATLPTPFIPSISTSKLHSFPTITSTHFTIPQSFRSYSGVGGSSEPLDQNKEVDTINLKFAEAREEIEMALESKDTVYFDEEAECARVAVNEVVTMFEGLLAKLPERDRAALQRSMGLKIQQLKAELQQLEE